MKFCTTCGRNFADDIEACPHDSTPLFYMGGEPGPVAQVDAETDDPEFAVDAAGVNAELDSAESPIPAEDEEIGTDSDSAHDLAASDEDEDLDAADEDAAAAETPLNPDESDEFEQDEAPSMQIQGSIASTIADLGGLTEDQPALSLDRDVDMGGEKNPDLLAPVKHQKKSGGGGSMIPLILVAVAIAAAGYYFTVMKPGQDEASRLQVEQEAAQQKAAQDKAAQEKITATATAAQVLEKVEAAITDVGNADAGADAGQTAGQTAAQAAEPVVKKPAVDKPVVRKQREKTKPADKPVDKPADKPVEKVVDKPVEKPADKPVEKAVEKPADKPKVEEKELSPEDLLKKELQKLKQGEE